jgi:DTW domain-containing protein
MYCPVRVDLMSHPRELTRPSSTGNLIHRVMPESRQHLWHSKEPPAAADILIPGRELWILHPHGRPAPVEIEPASIQVLLLDGLWNEATVMAREVASWGRLISLPMTGTSRYWLRAQQEGGRFSTIEALMFLLDFLGLKNQSEVLRIQFELHVYTSLRSRGRTDLAAAFLVDSPILQALPEFLAQLHTRRPLHC